MFNPKERLEQLRKTKTAKEEASSFLAHNNNPVPLFQEPRQEPEPPSDLATRLARLENTVNELSGQLKDSNQAVHVLRREKSELETKLLRLEYENSQLKVTNRST
jgi:phage shock protein A